jgi:hypothetical protein
MSWDRLTPPERAGDVAQRSFLDVQPLRRLEVDTLVVVDDDLPQANGATLFWLQRRGERWCAWAAAVDGPMATPWLIFASTLRLENPDAALLALVGDRTAELVGVARQLEPVPRDLACICREKSAELVYRAADEGWRTVDEVKRRTGVTFGECQGRRCVAGIAARLDQEPGDRGASITPRPPLVPVPASILAAFAEV